MISAIGDNCSENFHSLKSLKSGIGRLQYLDSELKDSLPCAEVKHPNTDLLAILDIPAFPGMSRTALLGMIAATEAARQAGLTEDPHIRTAFISGTTGEAMTSVEAYFRDFQENDSKNEYIETQDWGHSTDLIAHHLGLKGFRTTINTACSSAANAISLGARLIRNGMADRALVGGTDALSKVLLNGFNTLMILDSNPTKPFDKNRNGMNLGEGAAYLVLESEALANKNNIIAEYKGHGIMSEAYHLTAQAVDGDGAFKTMNEALINSNLSPEDIDYINAHGTGSLNNDQSEGTAIGRLFKTSPPPISSTKPYTGHTLGATGALEAVISIFALQHNLVFPNLNLRETMDEIGFSPAMKLLEKPIKNVLSNALGFGGNNTTLIFSAC